VLPSFRQRYESALDGHSRGVELVVYRRSPNGLSGWVAYNLASTTYQHAITGEAFAADYDQRHTVNMYGVYRFSDRMSFSARFRAGSNFPVPGYFESRNSGGSTQEGPPPFYFVSTTRNNLRVPVYSRLDVRANRTFSLRATRITLFAEVLNAYARDNVRAASPGINGANFQAFGLFDSMFPLIPSAGLSLEF
jgi:hypothetical protein